MPPDWLVIAWLVALVLSPLYLWWASGVTVKDKYMGAGDDRPRPSRPTNREENP